MSKSCDVAIVGVTGMIGDILIDVLDDHDFSIGKLHLVDEEKVAGGRLMYKGQSQRVEPLERFDFSQVQVVVFLGSETVAEKWVPQMLAAGCSVIDASGASRGQTGAPMIVADANPHALADFTAPGLVACPDSQVVQAVLALQPVLKEAGLQSVAIATYQSMSTLDQEAVEGLALQTGRLLNGQPPEAGALAKQAAFNLIPRTGDLDEHGYTRDESRLGEDVRRVLVQPDISVAATCVVVPVFYGTAAVLQLRTREVLATKRLATLLRKAPGVKLLDKPADDGFPTPVTEATGSDAVWIGRLRADPVDPLVLNMWIVSDNLRKGVVLNSLQTLRLLIKDYL
ncbi:aspartate-semialdehyde dehydrogenase [Halopseudomonas salina]|uniref:Aspartate-semialdehyde dehydrogenase n=1 Tax=Halopseudomonas salina TaxID=1323744 RepID=A0ABQ1Q082_9GAMM|nr:aspartate-semialdehyde dehydrogenase [Halopseudomonas salina]GGD08679.1 aspartate-semialdehyde dehydrogenase [Halopseudomonas salina]